MPSFIQRVGAALAAASKGFKAGGIAPGTNRAPRPISLKQYGQEMGQKRSYAGANFDRLTEDFLGPLTTGDAEMRTRIRTLRQRARELERNDPYTRRYLSRLEDNIYDHHGITFSSQAGIWMRGKGGRLTLQLDAGDAAIIDQAYTEWRKNPYVTGDMSLNEGGRLSLRSVARDGDMLDKWVVDSSVNKFGFALQQLEADMCDDYRNDLQRSIDGRVTQQVRMGVEVNRVMRPIAYWILKEHPGDQQWWNTEGYWSERHPADEYLHPFHKTRITQVRDVTWLCAIMRDLNMLDGYDEAAIVAARTGAAKMGFITRGYNDPGAPYTGEENVDPAEAGDKAMDATPGLIEDLSQTPGLEFKSWDPAYPHEQYPEFIRTRLRRIGAGVDMSYYAIANDLTDVNFSSIRAGILEDRERFKSLQTWWIARHETPIFLKWLEICLLNETLRDPVTSISLPFSKKAKFEHHSFRPRRWPWVDPEKDANASKIAVDNRFKSRNEVIEETGENTFADVIAEQAAEQELAENLGVELPPVADAQPVKSVDTSDSGDKPKNEGKKNP